MSLRCRLIGACSTGPAVILLGAVTLRFQGPHDTSGFQSGYVEKIGQRRQLVASRQTGEFRGHRCGIGCEFQRIRAGC